MAVAHGHAWLYSGPHPRQGSRPYLSICLLDPVSHRPSSTSSEFFDKEVLELFRIDKRSL